MINDSVIRKKANCCAKYIEGHLCIFALRDIQIGEELTYFYGATEESMYWRLVSPLETSTLHGKSV